jgi:Zn-dependent protease with chaperone function
MVQEGGSLNACASRHNRTDFIRINSDILEVGSFDAGLRGRDREALDFIIAHEVGHVAAGHVTYWYTFLSSFVFYVPLIGQALSRAKEYTADNYAFEVAPDGIQGITMLSGGKYLYSQIDGRKFAERAVIYRGFFIWLVNAFSSHPVQTKRHQALYDRKRAGRIL